MSSEYTPGEKNTLWQYFKTVEFWSDDDTLLTPLLILDQFEEIFALRPEEFFNIRTTLIFNPSGEFPKSHR